MNDLQRWAIRDSLLVGKGFPNSKKTIGPEEWMKLSEEEKLELEKFAENYENYENQFEIKEFTGGAIEFSTIKK